MENLATFKPDSWLSWFLRGILILGFLFLSARLTELQVIKGDYYRKLSDENRIVRVPIPAPRGRILARGGEVLVGNKEIKKKLEFDPQSGFKVVNIDSADTPQDEKILQYIRYYALGEKFAHVSGYLGEVNEAEVGKINPKCPQKGPEKLGTLIGRSGLEEEYDCTLAGVDGEELIEVDISGNKVRTLGIRQPIAGNDVKTTVDYNLQQKVFDDMGGLKGAAIVSDTQGQVLALVSIPSYDPNIFVTDGNSEQISTTLNDTDLRMFNRAIGGLFHPGSVFKPIVALAALNTGVIDENFLYKDEGVINVNGYSYTNWYFTQYGGVEGEINVVRALARSTDTFFYKIGEMVGPNNIAKYAGIFGLNKDTGIDLPGEVAGLVPTPDWKQKVKGEPWYLGNTYHFSIGQGDLSISPIELHNAVEAIANGGKLCPTRIATSADCSQIDMDKKYFNLVKEGMENVCSTGGTGYTFFDFNFSAGLEGRKVACKTGTAETNQDGKTHAWFTVFGPSDLPEVVATVVLEQGGEGSSEAGPIARKIFDYWFNNIDD